MTRPVSKRTAAATAVVLLLLAQIGTLVHHAAVRHVRCGHGELVEAATLAKHSAGDSQLVAVTGDGDAGDEHCAFTTVLGTENRLSAPDTAVCDPIADVPITIETFTPTAAVYRTAPKTSPPA